MGSGRLDVWDLTRNSCPHFLFTNSYHFLRHFPVSHLGPFCGIDVCPVTQVWIFFFFSTWDKVACCNHGTSRRGFKQILSYLGVKFFAYRTVPFRDAVFVYFWGHLDLEVFLVYGDSSLSLALTHSVIHIITWDQLLYDCKFENFVVPVLTLLVFFFNAKCVLHSVWI